MKRGLYRCLLTVAVGGVFLGAAAASIRAQQAHIAGHGGHASPQDPDEHAKHGTPAGWKFTWPRGDAPKGREVFEKLECYRCHEVKGEAFPAASDAIGPELSMMAPLHDAEYFAEAIINPTAVIEAGKGYEAEDGTSKMPSYNDLVTVHEVIDLVAYLKALRPSATTPASQSRAHDAGGHYDKH
ncbi:MAG TPA: c-type cytochrome [Alphaproteobacteria bacterium]|nr:c-type cytochrome [Alphaproteobacteria bacterium]